MNCISFLRITGILLLLAATEMWAGGRTIDEQPGTDVQAQRDFNLRVQQYMILRTKATALVLAIEPTSNPNLIADHRAAMAAFIAGARTGTAEESIFTFDAGLYFRRLIHSAWEDNPDAVAAALACRSSIHRESLKANSVYPENAEYPMMPATILRYLPQLPSELEYRIINQDLLIRDREANLVVDILRNAVEQPPEQRSCED